MLPWNFLISISAFWNYKFRNIDLNSTSPDMSLDIIRTNHTSIFIPQMAADIPVPLPVIKPTEIQESFPSYLAIGNYKNSVKNDRKYFEIHLKILISQPVISQEQSQLCYIQVLVNVSAYAPECFGLCPFWWQPLEVFWPCLFQILIFGKKDFFMSLSC